MELIALDYQKVKERVISEGHTWFDGIMDPNLIFYRNSSEYTNGYTDTLALCWKAENGEERIFTKWCSTKPALYGEGSVTNPNWVDGMKAVGVIAEGQHRAVWKMSNFEKLHVGQSCMQGNPHLAPSLHQVGRFIIYRDGDLDKFIDTDIEKPSDWQGFNCHYAGEWALSYENSGYLPWSTGCFTMTPAIMFQMCLILQETIKYNGDIISCTVIKNY
jgi:hypothetical protein